MEKLSLLHSVSANTLSSSRPDPPCGAGSSSLSRSTPTRRASARVLVPAVLVFADNPSFDTAPLPVLVAMAGLGFLMLRSRGAGLRFLAEMFAGRISGPGRPMNVIVGYLLLIVGLAGTVLWFVDNLA